MEPKEAELKKAFIDCLRGSDLTCERNKWVFAEAQEEILKEKRKKYELSKFFEKQLSKLDSLGAPEGILQDFRNKKDEIIIEMFKIWTEKYSDETLGSLALKGICLGFPVIPRGCMSVRDLMAMARCRDEANFSCLNPSLIADEAKGLVNFFPRYLFDIEDGRALLDKAPEYIDARRRGFLMNVEESIFLVIYTKVLSHHNISARGSRWDSNFVPILYLKNKKPELDVIGHEDIYEGYGTPSYMKGIRVD